RDTSLTLDEFGPLKSLSINYTTPGVDKEDVLYSFYLEGFDKEWSSWNDQTRKQYTNLPGGTYTFHVKSKFNSGEELRNAQLIVTIPTAWYNSPWAKVSGGLLIWLMVVGIYKLRTRHLKVRNKKLGSLISQRTAELRYANEELLKRNYELDQFVRRVSHDLVAPIKSVKALMEIARNETTQEEQDKCFDMINLSLDKQEDFVKKLLDQAINYKEVNREEIELNSFCKDLIKDLSNYDGAEHVAAICEIPNDFRFHTDPIRLKIVLKNLIDNSIKYRKLHEVSSRVVIRAYANDENVFIEIEDNGIGISEEHLEYIFGMFKRATDQRHGSGLGLYIVKDVVSSLGGKIELSSTLNEGSKFTMTFPK
ncbi:MAG: ATP-binding protein, partial [Cyclobacteriaceae bacterium]